MIARSAREGGARRLGGCGVGGYIMLEAAVALVLLSVGTYAVHRTIQQAVVTRGQAQDYTQVRFLLDEVIAEVGMQPELVEGTWPIVYTGANARFRGEYRIRRVDPPLPPQLEGQQVRYQNPWLAHMRVTLRWARAGEEYEESMETLFSSGMLWQPVDRR